MNIDVNDNAGNLAIHTYLKRVKEGVKVHVRVIPEVEDFFKHWGTELQVKTLANGKAWRPMPPLNNDVSPLLAWQINPLKGATGHGFDIYSVGRNLSQLSEHGQNISFIRLVGASKGVDFLYEDVVSWDGLNELAERIRNATARFYDQFIRPVNMQIMVDIKRIE